MNSVKLVIPLHSLYWSIHTKDESKRGTAFAFIFDVNWLCRCGVSASFGIFFHEMKCSGMTSFMEFMWVVWVIYSCEATKTAIRDKIWILLPLEMREIKVRHFCCFLLFFASLNLSQECNLMGVVCFEFPVMSHRQSRKGPRGRQECQWMLGLQVEAARERPRHSERNGAAISMKKLFLFPASVWWTIHE